MDVSDMLIFKYANAAECKGLFAFDYAQNYKTSYSTQGKFELDENENCLLLKRSLRFKLKRNKSYKE